MTEVGEAVEVRDTPPLGDTLPTQVPLASIGVPDTHQVDWALALVQPLVMGDTEGEEDVVPPPMAAVGVITPLKVLTTVGVSPPWEALKWDEGDGVPPIKVGLPLRVGCALVDTVKVAKRGEREADLVSPPPKPFPPLGERVGLRDPLPLPPPLCVPP